MFPTSRSTTKLSLSTSSADVNAKSNRKHKVDGLSTSNVKKLRVSVESPSQPKNRFVFNVFESLVASCVPIALQKRGLAIPGSAFTLHGMKTISAALWSINKKQHQWILEHLNEEEQNLLRSNRSEFLLIWQSNDDDVARASAAIEQFEKIFVAAVAASEVVLRSQKGAKLADNKLFSMQGRIVPSLNILKSIERLNNNPNSLTITKEKGRNIEVIGLPATAPLIEIEDTTHKDNVISTMSQHSTQQVLKKHQFNPSQETLSRSIEAHATLSDRSDQVQADESHEPEVNVSPEANISASTHVIATLATKPMNSVIHLEQNYTKEICPILLIWAMISNPFSPW